MITLLYRGSQKKKQHDVKRKHNGKPNGGNQMDTLDTQTNIIIPGIKLKVLSTKNEHGTNQLSQVLDEQQFHFY